ncbi:MAG: GNAT family N-acetyltransferase [Dehalococcoidia bacterium]|jgi:CelD/BcsL family acetyltransferase involved in cellulose biosynthesis
MKALSESPIQVSRLDSLDEMATLQGEWRELESRCVGLTPFSTWEWCDAVGKYRIDGRPLSVFTLRDRGELLGVAPFASTRLAGLRTFRLLSSALGRYSIADYQDLPIADDRRDEVIDALCDALARERGWDVLHLQELPRSSKMTASLMEAAARRGWPVILQSGSDVHMLNISGDWESYRQSLSRSVRNDTGRQTRKLFGECEASFANVGGDETAAGRAMQRLFDLHTQRWQAAGEPGIFRSQARRDFHLEVARRFAGRGMLALPLLQAGNDIIAIKYGFQTDGTVYYYAAGYSPDEQWRHYRLGMILDLQIMEDAFARGLRCVDLMRGEGHYKDHYRMDTHLNQDLLVFRNRRSQLQYRMAVSARAMAGRLRDRLRKTRAKSGAAE